DFNTNGTDTVAPTPTRTTDGFIAADTPSRQLLNWLFERYPQWLRYLDERKGGIGAIAATSLLPGGTALPGTGSVSQGEGHFVVSAILDDVRLTASAPAFVYPTNSDTYWDLDADAVLTATTVPTIDPEPALAAGSLRVGRVRTSGATISSAVDNRPSFVSIDQMLSFDRPSGGRIRLPLLGNDPGPVDVLLGDDLPESGSALFAPLWQIYQSDSFPSGPSVLISVNATRHTAQWTQTRGVAASYLFSFGQDGLRIFHRPAGSAAWADTVGASGWLEVFKVTDGGAETSRYGYRDSTPRVIPVSAASGSGTGVLTSGDRVILNTGAQHWVIPVSIPIIAASSSSTIASASVAAIQSVASNVTYELVRYPIGPSANPQPEVLGSVTVTAGSGQQGSVIIPLTAPGGSLVADLLHVYHIRVTQTSGSGGTTQVAGALMTVSEVSAF
ncbi:MAG: hypothetical protein AAFU79_02020, partial [Myxococcota bacterium]